MKTMAFIKLAAGTLWKESEASRSNQVGGWAADRWWTITVTVHERRETRNVGQREEKRTREAGTKMQCSTW